MQYEVITASAQDIIQFLRSIMPQKPISDPYSAIGYNKHAKTELFRDILRHMRSTTDLFELAPGIPGLVMSVFTMPSYDVVFKVIRDDIAEPKRTTVITSYSIHYTKLYDHGVSTNICAFHRILFQLTKYPTLCTAYVGKNTL